MKVKDLIIKLLEFNADLEVRISLEGESRREIDDIKRVNADGFPHVCLSVVGDRTFEALDEIVQVLKSHNLVK